MPCIVTSSHVWISLAEPANSNQRCHPPPQQLQTILPQCNNLGAEPSTQVLLPPAKKKRARTRQPQGTSKATTGAPGQQQHGHSRGKLVAHFQGAQLQSLQAEDGVIFVKPENIGVFVRVVALTGMAGCRPADLSTTWPLTLVRCSGHTAAAPGQPVQKLNLLKGHLYCELFGQLPSG